MITPAMVTERRMPMIARPTPMTAKHQYAGRAAEIGSKPPMAVVVAPIRNETAATVGGYADVSCHQPSGRRRLPCWR